MDTTIKDSMMGGDIKELFNHPDMYNHTDINLKDLDDNILYMVTTVVGLYSVTNKSGIHIINIDEITEEYIEAHL